MNPILQALAVLLSFMLMAMIMLAIYEFDNKDQGDDDEKGE